MTIDSYELKDDTKDGLELFEKMFESIEIEFAIETDGSRYISCLSVAKALEYSDPWRGYADLIRNNAEYFEGEIKEYSIGSSTKKYLSRKGLDLFLLFSGQSKAKDFKLWVTDILEERRNNIERLDDSDEQVKWIAQQIIDIIDTKKQMELEINGTKKELGEVREKVDLLEFQQQELADELINITKTQRYKIQNKAKEIVVDAKEIFLDLSDRKLYGSVYGLLKDCLTVPKYEEIPRERFDEALKILECLHKLILAKKLDLSEYITADQLKTLCRQNALF